jgi:hypothetical protein
MSSDRVAIMATDVRDFIRPHTEVTLPGDEVHGVVFSDIVQPFMPQLQLLHDDCFPIKVTCDLCRYLTYWCFFVFVFVFCFSGPPFSFTLNTHLVPFVSLLQYESTFYDAMFHSNSACVIAVSTASGQVCMHACIHTSVCVCVFVCLFVCLFVCVH